MRGTCNIDNFVMSKFVSVKYISLTTQKDAYYNFKEVQEDSSIRGITQVKNVAMNYRKGLLWFLTVLAVCVYTLVHLLS